MASKGFTIIEALIGIALFGVMMPVVILAVLSLGDINDRAADLTRANVAAEKQIESLRSAGYNTLEIGPAIDFTGELDTSLGEPRSASYTVTSPTAGVKEVDINISYAEKETQRVFKYKSIISELGVAQ